MDLTKLSDGDLKALATNNLSGVSNEGLKYMSGAVDAPSTSLAQHAGNLVAGAVRGAGSMGATILSPIDAVARAMNDGKPISVGGYDIAGQDRRTAMDAGLQGMGAQPDSMMYQGGKLGAEIAGTAGAGGVLAKGVQAVSQAPRALQLAEALRTGGMSAGEATGAAGMATRIGGGAVAGGAQAGLIDPRSAGFGAATGAVLPGMAAGIPKVGGLVADVIGGLGTRTGGEGLKIAARAGMEGGSKAATFVDNMRGNVPIQDVLDTAKSSLNAMGAAKSAEYREGMAQVSGDKSILDFGGIDKSLQNTANIVTFKGQVKNQKAAEVQQNIADEVNKWKSLNPAEYHTPEGLDALKQKIGGIVESIPFEEKTARMVGNNIYNSIKAEITKQAPVYDKVMRNYSEASAQIKEIERALSLGGKSSIDTAMRKLQSLMRNNVNTNYGNRLDLAKRLDAQGGGDMLSAIAGQSLNTLTPRGLGGAVAGGLGLGGYAMGGPQIAAPVLAAQSPRLMGEAALATGRLASLINNQSQSIYRTAPALSTLLNRDNARRTP